MSHEKNSFTLIRHWLVSPRFDDEDKTRAANLLNTITLTFFFTSEISVPFPYPGSRPIITSTPASASRSTPWTMFRSWK